ncbi:MAG TPA: hypothetical protein VGI77_14075 [Gaiellaceae bacterium]
MKLSSSPETLLDPLMERINRLLPGSKARPEWGSASLSTTPTSLAVQDLVARIEALEDALREVSLEVQKLSPRP